MEQTTQPRMTRQQVLDDIFKQVHGQRTRVVQLSVPGREVTLAHVIGKPDPSVYTNLCLEIGFHADFDQEGRAIGILQLSPAESAVIAADVAVKDRFSGALIITGARAEVDAAMEENLHFFRDDLHFRVCMLSQQ